MTTIDQIKQELRDIIELSNKATPGEWIVDGLSVYAYKSPVACTATPDRPCDEDGGNARLIAVSRNLTPKMARALLGVITALENDEASDAPITRLRATIRLETIRREWEVQA